MKRRWNPEPTLYLIATRSLVGSKDYPDCIRAALDGGVGMLQMREKGATGPELMDLGRRLRALCESRSVPFIVNDDPSLAVALSADGVHLGQGDATVSDARKIMGEDRWIGLSTHDEDQIRAAGRANVDMIGVGPVFRTTTKDAGPPVGIELLARAWQERDESTVFPIGGIGLDEARLIHAAGGRRIAVSTAILAAPDPGAAAAALRAAIGDG